MSVATFSPPEPRPMNGPPSPPATPSARENYADNACPVPKKEFFAKERALAQRGGRGRNRKFMANFKRADFPRHSKAAHARRLPFHAPGAISRSSQGHGGTFSLDIFSLGPHNMVMATLRVFRRPRGALRRATWIALAGGFQKASASIGGSIPKGRGDCPQSLPEDRAAYPADPRGKPRLPTKGLSPVLNALRWPQVSA
jgi:hypothetical protein